MKSGVAGVAACSLWPPPPSRAGSSSLGTRYDIAGCMLQRKTQLLVGEHTPLAGPQCKRVEMQPADGDAYQAKRGVSHSRCHTAYLPVLALGQFQPEPRGRDRTPVADRHRSWREAGVIGQKFRAGGKRSMSRHDYTGLQAPQRIRGRNPFHLCQIDARVAMLRIEQPGVQPRIIAQQQQALAVVIEPADRIDIRRKSEERKCFPGALLRLRELGEDAVGLVECYVAPACIGAEDDMWRPTYRRAA